MSKFSAKRILVTGGTTGIGRATAAAFLAAGGRVAITGRDPDRTARAAEELGSGCLALAADSAHVGDAEKAAAFCRDEMGGLDVIVLNAGICLSSTIADLDEDAYGREMDTNLKGPLFLVQACLPVLSDGGSILMTTSANDAKGIVGQLVYSSTKAALRSVVRTLAAELAPRGIRVNGVAPGPIDTPIFDKATASAEEAAEMRAHEADLLVLKRLGRPEEVANAFVFLAGPCASFITGANLRVDAGWVDI